MLLSIARELNVPATSLTEGADSDLTGALLEAAAQTPNQTPETSALAEFVGRFPGWSRLLASVHRQTRDQEVAISALSDRLAHDPFLAESLHLMLSNITAIRSTAEILRSVDDITNDQRARFHVAIHDESKRLSEAAQALITYFDKSDASSSETATPEEELDAFLSQHNHRFPLLDRPDATNIDIKELLSANPMATLASTKASLALEVYLSDAHAMPLENFAASALSADYNPSALAAEYEVTLHAIFRRLAGLNREGVPAPTMGLLVVNAAGQALLRHPLPDFPLPRHGNACPLWPVYQSFTQPDRPHLGLIEMPDGQRFTTLSVALPCKVTEFGITPDYRSAMLVIPKGQTDALSSWLSGNDTVRQVGTSCRICPRQNCAARSEETVL